MSGEVNNEVPRVVAGSIESSIPTVLASAAGCNGRGVTVTDAIRLADIDKNIVEQVFNGTIWVDTKPTNPKDRIGTNKASMSVVPIRVIAELGVAMTEGALKYGPYNYRESGVRGSIYFDATLRHLFAWWEGEDIDPDSGLSHVAKAIASLAVLRDGMMQGNWTDDRAPKVEPFYPELHEKTQALKTKYPPS